MKKLILATAIGIMAFWIYFFLIENSDPSHSLVYLAFERSFWLPDLFWIVPALLISHHFSGKNNPLAIISSSVAAGALGFLGLVDLSFCIQQSASYKSFADAIAIAVIATYCLIFAIFLIIRNYQKLSASLDHATSSGPKS